MKRTDDEKGNSIPEKDGSTKYDMTAVMYGLEDVRKNREKEQYLDGIASRLAELKTDGARPGYGTLIGDSLAKGAEMFGLQEPTSDTKEQKTAAANLLAVNFETIMKNMETELQQNRSQGMHL